MHIPYTTTGTGENEKINGTQGTVPCARIKNTTENVSVTNGKICEYFYHTKNETEISGICIECDEGYLYIRSSSFRDLEIFLSSKRFNVQEFVSCEAYNKEIFGNLKRIDAFKIMNKQES